MTVVVEKYKYKIINPCESDLYCEIDVLKKSDPLCMFDTYFFTRSRPGKTTKTLQEF